MLSFSHQALSQDQEKNLVQVKTLDQQLHVVPDLPVSVNGKEFVSTGGKGAVFMDLNENELPPLSVKIKNDDLEVESWNYSKGVLEIIVRKKKYDIISIKVLDNAKKPLTGMEVAFYGKKTFRGNVNENGFFELPLSKDESVTGSEQFDIKGYTITELIFSGDDKIIIAEPIQQKIIKEKERSNIAVDEKYFRNFDLKNLDSIQSLTVFYAVFKNYQIEDLDARLKQRIDKKFNELIFKLQDSLIENQQNNFIGRISDSSLVKDDVDNILNQAITEGEVLDELRREFDDKIQIISDKLSNDREGLDDKAREDLLISIGKLEKVLERNEKKFYRNLIAYRTILNSLKEKLLHIENLEEQLSFSEAQRLEDQKTFQKRILTIFVITVLFGLLILLLIYFSNKLRRQQKALLHANEEVKRINENLENLIYQRTRLLENAISEMDTFFYRASHDLRRPISSILGLYNVAKYTAGSESLKLFEKVSQSAHEMDRMLKKLQVINEINHPRDHSLVQVNNVIELVKNGFNEFIAEHKVNFEIECSPGLSFPTYPRLIEIILSNLVENSLYYSVLNRPDSANVKISASRSKDNVEFIVYDNGVGIDAAIHERLWTMFFVGNERSKGNGLGLYIVKKAVEALNGKISFESERYVFTKFLITLPYN